MNNDAFNQALRLCGHERWRQETLKAEGRYQYTPADGGLFGPTPSERLSMLAEELGEVAREVLTQQGRRLARDTTGTMEGLVKELVQVAAVSLAWVEGIIDRGEFTL